MKAVGYGVIVFQAVGKARTRVMITFFWSVMPFVNRRSLAVSVQYVSVLACMHRVIDATNVRCPCTQLLVLYGTNIPCRWVYSGLFFFCVDVKIV